MSFKHTVVMPKMSMTMETGELIGFHVSEGDEVKAGDVLFEVMTDKIDMEVEAPADGIIEKLVASPGAVLEVGKPVLIMGTQTQVLSFNFDSTESNEENSKLEIHNEDEVQPAFVQSDFAQIQNIEPDSTKIVVNENPKSVPAARTLAREKGVNLQTISPTGPFGTISYEDVLNANTDPAISARKQANKTLIAKGLELTNGVPQNSFTRTISIRKENQSDWHANLLAKWAKTLRSVGINENNDIGVALIIESKYGSALPVFKNPDQLDFASLVKLVSTTSDQARNGKVPLSMLNGATTTVFDLTHYKMVSNRPPLFPNQSTGLTVGFESQDLLSISLTIDLRVIDFYDGAILLDRLIEHI